MSGESESSDSDSSKIITSDEEGEFLEEITTTEIEMRGENVQRHTCRICLEDYPFDFVSPCDCRGSLQYVHKTCLDEWRLRHHAEHSNRNRCQQCLAPFNYEVDDNIDNFSDFLSDDVDDVADFKENYELAAWFLLLSCNVIVLIILLTWAHSGIHQRKYNQLFFTSFIVTTGNVILIPITAKVLSLYLFPYILWAIFQMSILCMLVIDLDLPVYILQGTTFGISMIFLSYHKDKF